MFHVEQANKPRIAEVRRMRRSAFHVERSLTDALFEYDEAAA